MSGWLFVRGHALYVEDDDPTRYLYADAQWARIPVVVFSGLGDFVNPDIMARLNVSNVLSKTGIRGDDLVRLIGDIL